MQLQSLRLLPRTRRRLERFGDGLKEQRAQLVEHFGLLGAPPAKVARGSLPFGSPAGSSGALKCYEHLFRDWGWGVAEAAQSLDLVRRLAPPKLGKLAVYGAGAGRLAVDVHRTLGPELTVATDLNPFPLLVAARLIQGATVRLPEFPIGPHAVEDEVVFHSLRCDARPEGAFSFAFADVLRPPFAPASLDTVLTSWVIDALDSNLEQTLLAIQRVLRPYGTWINIGPLRFDGPLAEAHSLDEVLELARGCGFEVTTRFTHAVDYFHSPHSGTRRTETVFCFAARKATGVTAPLSEGVRAAWLIDPQEPVKLTGAASSLRKSSVLAIGVLGLVDGQRSLQDIAEALAAQWRLPPEALIDPLREFLAPLTDR